MTMQAANINGFNGNDVFRMLSEKTEEERAKMHSFFWWEKGDISSISDDPDDFVDDYIEQNAEDICGIIRNLTDDEKYDILVKVLRANDDGFPSAFYDEVCDSIKMKQVEYAHQKLVNEKHKED